MGGEEQRFIREAFSTNWIAPVGANINHFEDDIQTYLSTDKEVIALNSGTSALHLGLKLLGVCKDDEVLCQSLTFSASANPIVYLSAKPVFVDSERDTWNLCPNLLEQAIKEGISRNKKPKAIVAVHLYGMPYKVDEISAIANKYGIPVLEDAAEALGSSYRNIKCGAFGKSSIFSFNGNKIISTSSGGALLTQSAKEKEKIIFWATQSKDDAAHYQHSEIGYNYRMSNVLAGIGRGQMLVLENRIKSRRSNFDYYKNELSHLKSISFLNESKNSFSNRWMTCILLDSHESREKIRLTLEAAEIESKPIWKPMHLQPVFKNCKSYTNGVSEDLFKRGLCLPSGSNLTEKELEKVVQVIKSCF